MDSESDVSSLHSSDSPPCRRRKLQRRPLNHEELAAWRARKRRVEKRLWYLQQRPQAAQEPWELKYLQMTDADLAEHIERAAGILGRRERKRKAAASGQEARVGQFEAQQDGKCCAQLSR